VLFNLLYIVALRDASIQKRRLVLPHETCASTKMCFANSHSARIDWTVARTQLTYLRRLQVQVAETMLDKHKGCPLLHTWQLDTLPHLTTWSLKHYCL